MHGQQNIKKSVTDGAVQTRLSWRSDHREIIPRQWPSCPSFRTFSTAL